jgi:prepilin-type N-terminal cleavage/methylation domain-containing protein
MQKNKNNGFALLEIAIVLIIFAVMAGGFLKGPELIRGAKVKRFTADFRNTAAMIVAYQSIFRALPGDDPIVATRFPGATTATTPAGLIGNGVINGAWDSTTATDETCVLWQHLRLAALAAGSASVNCAPDSVYWPRNIAGGQIGIQSNMSFSTITGSMPGSYVICSKNILGKYVMGIDSAIDDGDPATGTVRAIDQSMMGGAPSTMAYIQSHRSDTFVVCMSI